jgi:hypothetical protein
MSDQITAWPVRRAASPAYPLARQAGTTAPPAWLTSSLLALASVVLFALACASAWLSYRAQVAYVLVHNGDQSAQARVWALLLDAGTAGVSVLRLYETLRARPGLATRVSLLGCVGASVTMNLLHAPSRTPGGYLVAVVPPVMYAVFLEHLLTNLRSLLIADGQRRSLWRTLALWVNFPVLMWRVRRNGLRRLAEQELTTLKSADGDGTAPLLVAAEDIGEVAQGGGVADAACRDEQRRRGRGLGVKRLAFEAALAQQVRCGDVRLFSGDERERNAAAYQAAASLPVPLSRGAARRYVVQALPRLEDVSPVGTTLVPRVGSQAH